MRIYEEWDEVDRTDAPDRVRWQDIAWTALVAFLAVFGAYAIVYWV